MVETNSTQHHHHPLLLLLLLLKSDSTKYEIIISVGERSLRRQRNNNVWRMRSSFLALSWLTASSSRLVRRHGASALSTTASSASGKVSTGARPDTSDYRSILLNDAPFMDVRAPVEYEKGSFPSACNIPLMTNDERHEVGLCYKEKGQDAAIELGHQLVSGRTREERTRQWISFAEAHPSHGYLYCFRGGLRSQLVQRRLLEETGVHYPLVTGGYKAMRQFLLEELDRSLETAELILVAGQTGAGKTRVIQKLPHIDLEGLAHHRGSTFGRWPEDPLQPSQIDFENSASIALLKLLDPYTTSQETPSSSTPKPWVFVEDEGNRIGNLVLPVGLRTQMKASKFVVVEEDMEERVDVILEDYVFDLGRRFAALHGQEEGRVQHRDFLLGGVQRLRKRLGGERYAELSELLHSAIKEHEDTGDVTLHRVFVEVLLKDYYDPMYDYQLDQREGQALFRGKGDAVVEWAAAEALKR